MTEAVFNMIRQTNEIMLTSTIIGGQFVIRVLGANPNTEAKYLKKAFDILVDATERVRYGNPERESISESESAEYETIDQEKAGVSTVPVLCDEGQHLATPLRRSPHWYTFWGIVSGWFLRE